MPSCDNVSRARRGNQIKLAALCLAMLLYGSLLNAQASPQANDSAPPASAQHPAPPAQSSPAQSTQPQTTPPAQSQPARPASTRQFRQRLTLDDHVKALAKALDLTEAQQGAVKRILIQHQEEILRLRRNTSISGEDRVGRLRALQDQTALQIRSVLNDEQKKKYNPLAARQLAPAPDQKSVEDWLKATTPH